MARRGFSRRTQLVAMGGTAALALGGSTGGAATRFQTGTDPSVITDWNETAVATLVTDAGKAPPEIFLWHGFVQAAVYNAVVGITGRYEPYRWEASGPANGSPQAAAAAAANRVLLHYFGHLPAAQLRLAAAYDASLSQIPDGAAKWDGVQFGLRAAEHVIGLRVDDGRFGRVPYEVPLAPGVWRPTPPASAPFLGAWLSGVTPLLIDSTSQFRPPAPPALTSATYAAEFNEVKSLGAKNSTVRTPAQTETATFIASIPNLPIQAALRDLATRRELDISDSARLFAAAEMSAADAIGACWDSKVHYMWWRPITAIHQAGDDGNPATAADPSWEPLLATPPYPDYASGLCSVTGAVTRALARALGSDKLDLRISSPTTGTTRQYEYAADLCADGVDARVWSGIHFRSADVAAIALGEQVADWAMDRYFLPKGEVAA